MTLQTHLNLETIKNNKALQVESEWGRPTISDILDNAKVLFNEAEKECDCDGVPVCEWWCKTQTTGWQYISHQILTMCQEDKTLAEIEKYILKELRK
jgi:hypothetical protein